MQILIDFLPIFIFFITYQYAGMYAATAAIIIAMGFQLIFQWLKEGKVNKMLMTSVILVTFFGSITLLLRDPIFIQWKPTVVNWLFAIAFIISRYFGDKTIAERIMGHAVELETAMWRQLNLMWVGNFTFLGLINIYVVYNYDESTWVNFKLFGMLGITLIMVIIQVIWIAAKTGLKEKIE
ncbi:MAG: septation protein A [Rhodospirillaceae bacterium]|nr:septation protein A [Rhodospirillaceae bacterium]|tara:strand:- start:13065 stop:13607 length:543 start_codon:yes stop_codon:yes gene_type:complete